jgi:15-cis-phytoene desaturase
MAPHVVVLGGGVGGLSAAHELAERGVEVTVVERTATVGGKARSVEVPNSATAGRPPLPGEHGFRFFPHFYRHLPDTMRRIPFPGNGDGVFGNLVGATRGRYARMDQPWLDVDTRLPRSRADVAVMLHTWFGPKGGLTGDDVEAFADHLWRILTTCSDRRLREYEPEPWVRFIEADRHSDDYRVWFTGLTRTLVAMSASTASTRTVGDVIVQLLLGGFTKQADDRVLNGPTNDAWLQPWYEHLRSRLGVAFRFDSPVSAIRTQGGRVSHVEIEGGGPGDAVHGDAFVAAMPIERFAPLVSDELLAIDPALDGARQLASHVRWMNGIQFFLGKDIPIVAGHTVYVDAPWGLTSISQQQFWSHLDLADCGDGDVRGVLSVDICTWDEPGLLEHRGSRRPAQECTLDEIGREVWAQLQRSLNVDGHMVLPDDGYRSFHLDPDIHPCRPGPGGVATNDELMLINEAGTWGIRPTAQTGIPNLVLASDYVRTNTDLACMEGANEAARAATNALLPAVAPGAPRCAIWQLHEPDILAPFRRHDERRFQKGLPWQPVDRIPRDFLRRLWRSLTRLLR